MDEYLNRIRYGARKFTKHVPTRSARPGLLQHPVCIKFEPSQIFLYAYNKQLYPSLNIFIQLLYTYYAHIRINQALWSPPPINISYTKIDAYSHKK